MKLLVFPHSHYCEKARWALDYKGLDSQVVPIMPGFHIYTVRKYAPETTVPVLLTDDRTVQGSSEIIDFLEKRYPEKSLTPSEEPMRQECLELEHSMDRKLGESLRRILYSFLLAYPDFICHCFTQSMPKYKQILARLCYFILRHNIYKEFVISAEEVESAKCEFHETMEYLAERLQGQEYLVGSEFSRADLSIASMLSILIMPKEHSFQWQELPDDTEVRDFYKKYENHPVHQWAEKIYRKHR